MLLNTSESSESTRILVYLVGLDIQLKQSEKENPAVKKIGSRLKPYFKVARYNLAPGKLYDLMLSSSIKIIKLLIDLLPLTNHSIVKSQYYHN